MIRRASSGIRHRTGFVGCGGVREGLATTDIGLISSIGKVIEPGIGIFLVGRIHRAIPGESRLGVGIFGPGTRFGIPGDSIGRRRGIGHAGRTIGRRFCPCPCNRDSCGRVTGRICGRIARIGGSGMVRWLEHRRGIHRHRRCGGLRIGLPCAPAFLRNRRSRFGSRVPGRNRQAQDIGSGAGVAGGDGGDQAQDFGGEDAFAGDDAFEAHQGAGVIGPFEAFEQEAVDQAARETYAHTHTRLGELIHLGRNQIIEVTIQMSRFEHRQHPRDRAGDGHGTRGRPRTRALTARLCARRIGYRPCGRGGLGQLLPGGRAHRTHARSDAASCEHLTAAPRFAVRRSASGAVFQRATAPPRRGACRHGRCAPRAGRHRCGRSGRTRRSARRWGAAGPGRG